MCFRNTGAIQRQLTALDTEVSVDTNTLNTTKLDKTAKAADSDKLDGYDSSYFLDTSATSQKKLGSLNILGNVGIGTTMPHSSLEIKGQSGQIFNVSGGSEGQVNWRIGGQIAVDRGFEITPSIAVGNFTFSNPALVIKNDGNVGIGTTNPAGYKLQVVKDGWKARFSGSDGYIDIGPANPGWAHIYTDRPNFIFNKPVYSIGNAFSSYDTGNLYLQTGGTTRMTILNSNGNVGIGTTNPGYKLTVKGDYGTPQSLISYDGSNGIFFHSQGGATHTNWLIGQQRTMSGLEFTPSTTPGGTTFSTPAMTIDTAGNVKVSGKIYIGYETENTDTIEIFRDNYGYDKTRLRIMVGDNPDWQKEDYVSIGAWNIQARTYQDSIRFYTVGYKSSVIHPISNPNKEIIFYLNVAEYPAACCGDEGDRQILPNFV
ncbi:MAG: hypothetical protein AB1349_08625 [Elusimicrobiota bacterium]